MFGLGRHGPDGKYAILLDIGSASVGAAIVASDAVTDEHPIIFTHREWAVIRDAKVEHPTRFIEEAILRAFLVLGSKGAAALRDYDAKATVRYIHVNVCAPWSHTITQQAEYENDETFTINNRLIESLIATAKAESIESQETQAFLEREGLRIITNQTLHTTANGYTIADPRGLEAQKLYLSHSTGLASSEIVASITEHAQKVFPGIKLTFNTFMLAYYSAIRELFPHQTDYCLIDVTGESTEVAVVRNNELVRAAHSLIGIQTLVRILVDKLKLPEETARTLLFSEEVQLNEKQQVIAESVFEEYVLEVSNVMRSLGDVLAIPKHSYLHTDRYTENFFKQHLSKAAHRATGGVQSITPITSRIFPKENTNDTSILLSAYLFHTLHKHGTVAKD